MGVPMLTSSSEASVRMVTAGDEIDKDVVILDSGSDASLLPLPYGHCGNDAVRQEVQLRDCQGSHLKVTGYRTVSLIVQDGDGELEHAFLIADVKRCILSLGQLYRNGWCVKQMDDGSGSYLESPNCELCVPVFYQRNSLAMKATVVVWSRLKMRRCFHLMPMSERLWSWKIGFAGPTNRKLLMIPTCDVSARTLWIPDQHGLATFGFRTTLVQRRSTAEEDHGWYVAEVSRKQLKLDDPFGPIPDLESYAQGEDVIVLTIVSEKEEALANFGRLLDAGGFAFEEPFEPESPYRGQQDDDLLVEGLEIRSIFFWMKDVVKPWAVISLNIKKLPQHFEKMLQLMPLL